MRPTDIPRTPPTRECDLVMKGGIASGIVYPHAVCELARDYRLRAVGGASAGAIAAAAAAAAEYGRAEGGFEKLAAVPEQLAQEDDRGDTALFRLFQPEASTRRLHALLVALLARERREPVRGTLRLLATALREFPLASLVGVLLGLAVVYGSWRGTGDVSPMPRAALLAVAVATGLLTYLVTLLAFVLGHAARVVPANGYGLCSGLGDGAIALTPWLHRTLQSLAGLEADGPPLTFGMLWRRDRPDDNSALTAPWRRQLDLRLMTTALSHGEPYSFPLEPTYRFWFRESELRRLFPAAVVDHLVQWGRRAEPGRPLPGDYVPLPDMQHLPVIVPVRMSLAFPVLLAAVPLHTWRDLPKAFGGARPERVWFSDGGICSNFPIHYFDAPLPTRPTFGINLVDTRFLPPGTAADDAAAHVDVPTRNSDGRHTRIVDVERAGWGWLPGLIGAVIEAMHNWNDNTQMRVPGYRDRIAHVRLSADEGGMNLRMAPALIRRVAARGAEAGRRLALHFVPGRLPADSPVRTTWANQRWVRFRVASQLIEECLMALREAERATQGTAESVAALHADPPGYRYGNGGDHGGLPQTRASLAAYRRILDLADQLEALRGELGHPIFARDYAQGPKPRSQLRIRPRL